MCVYSQITKWPIYYKKKEEKLLRFVAFCSLFCIMVQLGFSQQFRNENCFYIMISVWVFSKFHFPLENVQLLFSINSKNPTNFKMLGQCWGYSPADCGFLIHWDRDGAWAILGNCQKEHPSSSKVEWKHGPDESKIKYGWCFQRSE